MTAGADVDGAFDGDGDAAILDAAVKVLLSVSRGVSAAVRSGPRALSATEDGTEAPSDSATLGQDHTNLQLLREPIHWTRTMRGNWYRVLSVCGELKDSTSTTDSA